MISASELRLKLGRGIDRGVYCSPKRCFDIAQFSKNIFETGFAHDHEVDVAF